MWPKHFAKTDQSAAKRFGHSRENKPFLPGGSLLPPPPDSMLGIVRLIFFAM